MIITEAFKDLKDIDEITEDVNNNFSAEDCAFENACDCLKYGEGKDKWNSCGLSKEKADEIWGKAVNVMGDYDISKTKYTARDKKVLGLKDKNLDESNSNVKIKIVYGNSPKEAESNKPITIIKKKLQQYKDNYSYVRVIDDTELINPLDEGCKNKSLKEEDTKEKYKAVELKPEDLKLNEGKLEEGSIQQEINSGDYKPSKLAKDLVSNAMEDILDLALKRNQSTKSRGIFKDTYNVMFTGDAGIGKTGIIESWAAKRGVNLIVKNATTMSEEDLDGLPATVKDENGKNRYIKLRSTELDGLEKPNSVLFLDEFNRARASVRATFLTLIQNHTIADQESPHGRYEFKNLLFVIIAVNPSNSNYDTEELDVAENTRFFQMDVVANPLITLDYLIDGLDKEIQIEKDPTELKQLKGRKALALAILKNENFAFDFSEEIKTNMQNGDKKALNPRTFADLLGFCDGTKEDFLKWAPTIIPANKVSLLKTILSDYKDTEDKATDALKGGTDSTVFKKKDSLYNKTKNAADML